MKKRLFRAVLILSVLILSSAMYGKKVMTTVWGEKNPDILLTSMNNITICVADELNENFDDEQINDYDDLIDTSAIILKGKVDGERTMSVGSTDTNFIVDKIYKDDTKSLISGENIIIVEPFSIHLEAVYNSFGYQMLKKGEEYILFLNPLKCVDGYRYSNKEKISFMPSTQYFSRYCITMEEKMKLLEQNDDELLYSDYSENAFLTYDSNIKAKYIAIQEKIKFY